MDPPLFFVFAMESELVSRAAHFEVVVVSDDPLLLDEIFIHQHCYQCRSWDCNQGSKNSGHRASDHQGSNDAKGRQIDRALHDSRG